MPRRHDARPKSLTRQWVVLLAIPPLAGALYLVARGLRPPEPAPVKCSIDLSDVPGPPGEGELVFAQTAGQRGFPVVRATINGCNVRVLLDTGVALPAFLPWFADRSGMNRLAGVARAADFAGHDGKLVQTEPLKINVRPILTEGPVQAIIETPDDLRGYGIAAIVPPQFSISKDAVLALDLGARRYRRLDTEKDVQSEVGLRAPTFDVTGCDNVFLVSVMVGGKPAKLEVDTGSAVSTIYSESEAGVELAKRVGKWEERSGPAFSGELEQAVVFGVPTGIGEMSGAMSFAVMKTRGHVGRRCGFDGVLGVDFLLDRRCLLLFDVNRLKGYCRP
jgi:hypothetical protein